MPDTIAKRIVLAVDARLKTILTGSGFNTDAGNNVYRGRRSFEAVHLATVPVAVTVFSPETEAEDDNRDRIDNDMTVAIEFVAVPQDADNPFDTAQDVLGDIATAVELADRTLGGLAVNFRRAGQTVQMPADSATVVTGRASYAAVFPDLYGKPYDENLGA